MHEDEYHAHVGAEPTVNFSPLGLLKSWPALPSAMCFCDIGQRMLSVAQHKREVGLQYEVKTQQP
jgi:hypothetical protein